MISCNIEFFMVVIAVISPPKVLSAERAAAKKNISNSAIFLSYYYCLQITPWRGSLKNHCPPPSTRRLTGPAL